MKKKTCQSVKLLYGNWQQPAMREFIQITTQSNK